jgi:hypothetical protein
MDAKLWIIPKISEQPTGTGVFRTLDPSGELISLQSEGVRHLPGAKVYGVYDTEGLILTIPETQPFTFIARRRFSEVSQAEYLKGKARESEASLDLMAELQREFPRAMNTPASSEPFRGNYQ